MGGSVLVRCRLFHLPFLTHLVLLGCKKSLRIDGCHATRAGGGDRLAINMILHVAARKHTRNICLGAAMRQDITERI
jgi:hypothetical protein